MFKYKAGLLGDFQTKGENVNETIGEQDGLGDRGRGVA